MAILVLEHSASSSIRFLGSVLTEFGIQQRVVRVGRGESIPGDLDDVDGVIALGGPQSANDDRLPWLADELALIRAAHEIEMPVLGICLGSQLIARALGGGVGPLPDGGREIGFREVTLSPVGREDPMFAGIAWTSRQMHWHGEQVVEPPPGGRVLASSRLCKVQAYGVGLRTYAVQYHPETTREGIEQWIREDDGSTDLKRAGLTAEQLRQETTAHYDDMNRLARRFFETIALLLMPADRRYRGLLKDMRH